MKPQATTMRPESASPVDKRLFAARKRWRKVQAVTGRCSAKKIKVGGPHFFGVCVQLGRVAQRRARVRLPDKLVLTRSSPARPSWRRRLRANDLKGLG